MPVVLGTAGHIDHGKTSLVRALTGIDCDRLEEEKRRGITIELGFAWCDLPDGRRLGIVDVPGHERFVKNMVAGAAGIDFVMLVIAADEGVMPQTREHLEICSLLGIRHGFVALTKIDMVDPDWLELAREDIAGFLAGTFLEGAPILPVSSATGEGVDRLRAHVFELARTLSPQRRSDVFRLPVDRAFTMKGHGTVITGTVLAGKVAVGEDAALMPGNLPVRVRGLRLWRRRGRDSVAPSICRTRTWTRFAVAMCWPMRIRCSRPCAGWCACPVCRLPPAPCATGRKSISTTARGRWRPACISLIATG